jgi:hypothetical protein
MTASGPHDEEHAERVSLYLLQALPADEVAAAEAQINACEECRRTVEVLGPIVRVFVAWPTDVLRPPSALWDRVAERVATDTGREPASPAPRRTGRPEWNEVAPGIAVKVLATDAARRRVTMLVRLAPGTDYPSHRHAGVEELHLLGGELMIDDRKLSPGDYSRAEPDTVDRRVWSETGCTCVLITSPDDVLR